jgi:hypothetical protein
VQDDLRALRRTAGGFLRYVADAIENPGSALADM